MRQATAIIRNNLTSKNLILASFFITALGLGIMSCLTTKDASEDGYKEVLGWSTEEVSGWSSFAENSSLNTWFIYLALTSLRGFTFKDMSVIAVAVSAAVAFFATLPFVGLGIAFDHQPWWQLIFTSVGYLAINKEAKHDMKAFGRGIKEFAMTTYHVLPSRDQAKREADYNFLFHLRLRELMHHGANKEAKAFNSASSTELTQRGYASIPASENTSEARLAVAKRMLTSAIASPSCCTSLSAQPKLYHARQLTKQFIKATAILAWAMISLRGYFWVTGKGGIALINYAARKNLLSDSSQLNITIASLAFIPFFCVVLTAVTGISSNILSRGSRGLPRHISQLHPLLKGLGVVLVLGCLFAGWQSMGGAAGANHLGFDALYPSLAVPKMISQLFTLAITELFNNYGAFGMISSLIHMLTPGAIDYEGALRNMEQYWGARAERVGEGEGLLTTGARTDTEAAQRAPHTLASLFRAARAASAGDTTGFEALATAYKHGQSAT